MQISTYSFEFGWNIYLGIPSKDRLAPSFLTFQCIISQGALLWLSWCHSVVVCNDHLIKMNNSISSFKGGAWVAICYEDCFRYREIKDQTFFLLRTDYLKLENRNNLPATSHAGGKAVYDFFSLLFTFLVGKNVQGWRISWNFCTQLLMSAGTFLNMSHTWSK